MNCPQAEQIERYIHGRLNQAKSMEFETHLKNCSSCNEKVIEARKNESLLLDLHTFDAKDTLVSISKDLDSQAVDTTEQAQELLGEQYQVIRKVGQGASGVVFQVLDTVLDRQAAVKFLNKKDTTDNTSEERWREARLVGKLNHPNIAQIYHIGEQEEFRFIVMEWVDGRPLTEAWHDMKLEQRLGVFLQVLDGIAAAHRRGIVHRDIKPSNILVGGDSKAKILDFGIAVDTQLLESVETSFYHGTPAFSAPEQITPPVKISTATDVFALGVLLYNLLTDTLPFPQTDQTELFHAIRTLYPELPGAVQEKLPISLQNICLKALEKGPHQRYPDAQSLSEDINRYLRGEKVWSRPSFLTDKIQQEVFYHRQKLKVWNDNELITQSEFDKLENIYDRVISPPDPSIIESRKLSFSQVCLYLGGWIVAIGCFVLFYKPWEISMYWRPAPAIAATIFISVFGIVMWRKNESRLAVGFLATANLLIPTTILLTMGQWQILNPDTYPLGTESLGTIPGPGITIGNWQLLFSSVAWLICSLFFLRMVRSSIFMIFSIVALLALLTTVYIIAGMENWDMDTVASRYLFPGIGLFILGSFLDRRKLIKYAWPLCITGLLSIIIPLSVIAISDNTLFMWIWPGSAEPPQWYVKILSVLIESDDDARLLSLLFNGIIYLALARICRLQGTRLQRSIARILNWLGPLHILVTLRVLDEEVGSPVRQLIYRILLPIASFGFVFGSVASQMKSFFFSGLAGIAIAAHKLTDKYLKDYFAWPVSLIISGMMWMFFSWFVPRWKASKALKHKT